MTLKAMMAVAVAAAFAVPMAYAAGDKAKEASAGTSASQGATGNAGADAMFKSMDKDGDGFVTREEAKGTPHEQDFVKLDKNSDGKLSPQEHAAAPEHAGDKAATGATGQPKAEGKTEGKPKY